jgi:hypothetical protein
MKYAPAFLWIHLRVEQITAGDSFGLQSFGEEQAQ